MDTKYSTIEFNLEELDKEALINLILIAHKNNLTFNDAIVYVLEKAVDSLSAETSNDKAQLEIWD